jgi:hypothetical protein
METMHWGRVIRDALAIAILVAVGGLVVSLLAGEGRGRIPMPHIAASNFVLGTLGFLWAGAGVKEQRGRHLFTVAALVWVLGLTSVLFLGITLGQWLASALAILVACLIGGGLAALLFRAPAAGERG